MDTLKTIGVSALVALVVAGGFVLLFPKQATQVVNTLGSVASPDIPSPYLQWGGIYHYGGSTTALTQNASTTCSIQSPAATSTLRYAAIRFDLASTSAIQIEMGKATTAFATTTSLGIHNLGAGAQVTLLASSTAATVGGADPAIVFAPNTYFNVKLGGGGTGTVPSGKCEALWDTI